MIGIHVVIVLVNGVCLYLCLMHGRAEFSFLATTLNLSLACYALGRIHEKRS